MTPRGRGAARADAHHPSQLSLTKRLVFSLIPTVCLLVFAELGTRVYLFYRHGRQVKYLLAPYGWESIRPAYLRYRTKGTYHMTDPCSKKTITFTINEEGDRRRERVAMPKPPGTIRVIAVGGSTTFGINNSDEATWPALLEIELRRRVDVPVEVLNTGVPARDTDTILRDLEARLLNYEPDLVVYYEGRNNSAPLMGNPSHDRFAHVHRFHQTWAGRITYWLYFRSMFYTTILEKLLLRRTQVAEHEKADEELVPNTQHLQDLLRQLVGLLRTHDVVPVFVLQATKFPPQPSLPQIRFDDLKAQRAYILAQPDDQLDSGTPGSEQWSVQREERTEIYRTQIMIETVRRTGREEKVLVIDPRPAFVQQAETTKLFCDSIHLTDEGNRLLSQLITEELLKHPLFRRHATVSSAADQNT